jgi:hypothetical protein
MKNIGIIVSALIITVSQLIANDEAEVTEIVNKHWEYQNKKNWKKYVGTLYSGGTMNGDSNGSFWYMQESTVAAVTEGQAPSNEFNFKPRYIKIDVLEKDRVAIAYYYLVGSYSINGQEKNDYRTRVSQVFVKEEGGWKIKSGHFTPLYSGSGIPN